MTFEWQINVGHIISSLVLLVTIVGGLWKISNNELRHMEARVMLRIDDAKKEAGARLTQIGDDVRRLYDAFMRHMEKP